MLRDLFSLFPAYAGVIPCDSVVLLSALPFPRIRGVDPMHMADCKRQVALSPAYAGVIPQHRGRMPWCRAFPRIRGAYQKTPRKVLRECLKKVPIKQTNRPGFRSRKPGRFCMQEAGARAVPPTLRFLAFQGKMRKQKAGSVVERRRKATLPAV